MKFKLIISITSLILLISCLKDDTQYIDKVVPGIIHASEIQNGKYVMITNRDLNEDAYYDTSSYEFIGVDSVISIQTYESGSSPLYGTWERITDSCVTMIFRSDSSDERREIFSNAFIIDINGTPNLLLSPAKLVIGDSSSLVGSYYSYIIYNDYTAGDDIQVEYGVTIYDYGEWTSVTGVTVNDEFDYATGGGNISEAEIKGKYYQLIEFHGDYYLYGLYSGKYIKVE